MGRRASLALVLVLVVAGCQAPVGEQTPESAITVEGGNLSLSTDRVWSDVQRVMDADVAAPERVTLVENATELGNILGGRGAGIPRFHRLLGLDVEDGLNGTAFERMENGATANAGFIYILPSPDDDPSSTEWVLAHEFGHYTNLQLDRVRTLRSKLGTTTDARYVRRAVREGATVVATDAYLARYGTRSDPTAPIYERILGAVPAGELGRYGFSQYVFGYRYVSERVADPSELDAVFEAPPTTSEQVIHGYAPGVEPPAELNVTIEESETWRLGGTDRLGEAFIRFALENGVSTERAATGATGWGTDRLHYIRPADGGNASYAWVFRWDDRANATAFERTLREYLDDRGDRRNGTWSIGPARATVRTPTDRTTVLLLGDRPVVTETTVSTVGPGELQLVLPDGDRN